MKGHRMDEFARNIRRDEIRRASLALVAGVVWCVILGAALICVGRPNSSAATPVAVGAR